jgi:hypothetical protein
VDTAVWPKALNPRQDPRPLLREAARVATDSVLVTTPNCTQDFGSVPIEFSHMLDVDHRQFFTVETLRELLDASFERVEVMQSHPIDHMLAGLVLPRALQRVYGALARVDSSRPRYFSRLLGQGWVGGRPGR